MRRMHNDRHEGYGSAPDPHPKEERLKLRVGLDELLPTKTAARELPQVLDRLEGGEVDQMVITRRSVPRAVLISVARYEQLLQAEGSLAPTTAPAQ
jgi:prevent-host-death family protein